MFNLRITGDLGFEFWMDIPGYEGEYQISTYGRVKSLANPNANNQYKNERILSPGYRQGYMGYVLCHNGKHKNYQAHRLVAKTFLPIWDKRFAIINHKDENRSNNNVNNIEWCTYKYNSNYGTCKDRISEKNRHGSCCRVIKMFSSNGDFIRTFFSVAEAERVMGINSAQICACANHYEHLTKRGVVERYLSAGGYKWEWEEKEGE